jgi:hypothetical protein
MIKQVLLLMVAALTVLPAAGKKRVPKEKDMGAYLMVYHKDADHGLHMAISYDGFNWTSLNDDKPVIAGDTIAMQKGIRDPHIFRAPNGTFYLAMTDLHIYAQKAGYRDTEWERDGKKFGWGNNKGLVLMKSDDLIHWSRANIDFSQMAPDLHDIGCVWAPETAWDYQKNKLMIYYTMRHGVKMCKLYYSYVNDDFNTVETLPEVLFTYPKEDKEAIDGDICYTPDGMYRLMYCSHDGTAGVKQATSTSITGPWTYIDDYCDFEKPGCEAPHVFKLIGEQRWILMYDCYRRNPHNFGFAETSDFKTFKDLGHFDSGVMKRTNFSEQKHGAVCWLTKKEARRLEKYWGNGKRR